MAYAASFSRRIVAFVDMDKFRCDALAPSCLSRPGDRDLTQFSYLVLLKSHSSH